MKKLVVSLAIVTTLIVGTGVIAGAAETDKSIQQGNTDRAIVDGVGDSKNYNYENCNFEISENHRNHTDYCEDLRVESRSNSDRMKNSCHRR